MKRVISIFVLVAMVLALGVAASGCKSAQNGGEATGSYSDAIPGGVGDVSQEVLEALTKETSISAY